MYTFIGTCVDLPARHINEMVETSRAITYQTLRKYIGGEEIEKYGQHPSLKNDWHVRFYKSTFNAKKCVFIVHSGIEHVYTENKD